MAYKTARGGGTILRDTRGHAEVKWEIQNFLKQPYKKGECIQSPNFLFSDASWFLEIYPNGDGEFDSHGWISLFLCRTRGPGMNSVSFYFGIKVGGSIVAYYDDNETFSDHNKGYGEILIKRSELSNILRSASSDGTVEVLCTITSLDGQRLKEAASQTSETKVLHLDAACQMSQPESLHKEIASQTLPLEGLIKVAEPQLPRPEGFDNLSKNLKKIFLGGNFSDIKVKAGEREFNAHRVVLAARSPVFTAMFQHEMSEKNCGVIEILDMDPDHVHDFLLFLYTGQFNNVKSSNAVSLYKAADFYSVEDLKEECVLRMINELSVDSVLEAIHLAVVHNEPDILKKGTEYLIKNTDEILMTEKWELFYDQNRPLAKELILKIAKGSKTER